MLWTGVLQYGCTRFALAGYFLGLAGACCPVCDAGGQEDLLCGAQDATPPPLPDRHAGRWRLLCTLPGALPLQLAGVCAFCQFEEGEKGFSSSLRFHKHQFKLYGLICAAGVLKCFVMFVSNNRT